MKKMENVSILGNVIGTLFQQSELVKPLVVVISGRLLEITTIMTIQIMHIGIIMTIKMNITSNMIVIFIEAEVILISMNLKDNTKKLKNIKEIGRAHV